MPQRLLNGLLLLRRAFRYPAALRFRLVIARPFDNPVLRLRLGNVEGRDMQSRVLKDVILDLLIGGVVQQAGGVQAFQGELDADGFALYPALGKAHHRIHGCPDLCLDGFDEIRLAHHGGNHRGDLTVDFFLIQVGPETAGMTGLFDRVFAVVVSLSSPSVFLRIMKMCICLHLTESLTGK